MHSTKILQTLQTPCSSLGLGYSNAALFGSQASQNLASLYECCDSRRYSYSGTAGPKSLKSFMDVITYFGPASEFHHIEKRARDIRFPSTRF